MCGEVGLEGRFSLWTGAGWWARGDLGGPVKVTPEDGLTVGKQDP